MKRLLLIYNANAGRQKVKTMLPDILDVFAREGYLTTVVPTQARGDACRAASGLGASFDRVVCCGGDGTLNETVSGLMGVHSTMRPVLGYIPTGTTNDFSHNLSLPRGTEKLALAACGGVPRAIDLGRAGESWFTYVAAFGLFTDVSYSTPQSVKNMLGHTAYLIEGASRLASVQSYTMRVECGERVIEDEFIYGMVGNTVSVGGLLNLPQALVKLDDGIFEVLLIRKPKNALELQSIVHTLVNQKRETEEQENGLVLGFSAGQVTFTCQEAVPWTLDGEFGGEHTTLRVENHRQSLVLACGK